MTKLDKVIQIKQEALAIQTKLASSNAEEITAAMKEYVQLVDWFYLENSDFMAPQQYNAAKKDLEYFMFLVELAVAYHKQELCEENNGSVH